MNKQHIARSRSRVRVQCQNRSLDMRRMPVDFAFPWPADALAKLAHIFAESANRQRLMIPWNFRKVTAHTANTMLAFVLTACSSGAEGNSTGIPSPVTLSTAETNVVAYWHDIAAATVNAPAALATTAEEQRPSFQDDMATVHVAIYDATSAIDMRYKPYGITPSASGDGASMDAAVSAAAYGVLRALYPNRMVQYQRAYDDYVVAIPAGEGKSKGLALGADVAAAIVAMRANDGRSTPLAPYIATALPGRFRGVNPINRFTPLIKPFALMRADQFRPPAPPALDSTVYTDDFNEVKLLGDVKSTTRTAEQSEIARFHTELPAVFQTRNFGRFARSTKDVAEAARLMALIYVVNADALTACFEAKYFYDTWRPLSAIPLAGTDNNAATVAVADWTPSAPTPNFPEYPAAHSCVAGGLAKLLSQYYETEKVTFSFDSTVTDTTRTYPTTDALVEESKLARIYGGMHFRFSTVAGAALGANVADWTVQHYFGQRQQGD